MKLLIKQDVALGLGKTKDTMSNAWLASVMTTSECNDASSVSTDNSEYTAATSV